jgi:hypothetical protein
MKKLLLSLLLITIISFGLAGFSVNAMAGEHPSEHPTAVKAVPDNSEVDETKSEYSELESESGEENTASEAEEETDSEDPAAEHPTSEHPR